MDYPFEIYYPEDGTDDAPGAIRLSVAALIACLDSGIVDGVTFTDRETAPYFESTKSIRAANQFGPATEWDVWRSPHSFLHIKPQGALKSATEKITSAFAVSIRQGQLPTVVFRTDLKGSIDFDETWITTKVFMKWVMEHGLELDDLFNQYVSDENEIFSDGLESADSTREKKERLSEADQTNREHAKQVLSSLPTTLLEGTPERAFFDDLMVENAKLRAEKGSVRVTERPINTRERNALLTIIGALCKEAKIDIKTPSKAGDLIQSLTDSIGAPVAKRTIEEHLKKIPDALATRMK